jgi:hypothetical protein
MPLRMIGDVYDDASERCWQLFAANRSRAAKSAPTSFRSRSSARTAEARNRLNSRSRLSPGLSSLEQWQRLKPIKKRAESPT